MGERAGEHHATSAPFQWGMRGANHPHTSRATIRRTYFFFWLSLTADMRIQYPDQDSGPSPFPPQYTTHLHLNLDFEWKSSPCDFPAPCPSTPSISSSPTSSSLPDSLTPQFNSSTSSLDFEQNYISYTQQDTRMPKRRTSLQAILIPPFLSYPLSNASSEPPRPSARARSPSTSSNSYPCISTSSAQALEAASLESSRTSPPPDFLLDDDPFANHTGANSTPLHRSNATSPTQSRRTSLKQPRSPLAPEKCLAASPSHSFSLSECNRLPSSSPRLSPPSPPISGRQLRPAYTRPAFAPRPSLPSLHSLAQSDFVYPIKTRKGTLGARLPLEPWDVSAERESVLEEAPSFQGFDHATDDLESSLGPEIPIDGNELVHTCDNYAQATDAWPCKDPRVLDGEAPFLQPPIPFELGPEEGPNMFASLFGVLSSFSSSSLSRSSSTSSSSSVPVLSPDVQTQWGDDSSSHSRSPNRSSSEESAHTDISFEDDIVYPLSRAFTSDDWHSQSIDIDFLSVPGGFSTLDDFEPGTSAGTIRPLVNSMASNGISTPDDDWLSNYEDYATPESDGANIFDGHLEDMGEAVDGSGRENRTNGRDEGAGERQSSNGRGNSGQDWRQANTGGLHNNGRGSAGGDRRGGGSDDHRNDDWGASSAFSTPSDTESEDSEGEDTRHSTQQSPSNAPGDIQTSGDDDVPLAQRIPTALLAQRTIRKQVRDEKDERRRLRLLRRQQRQDEQQQQQRQEAHNQSLQDQESRHHMPVGPTPSLGPTQPTPSSSRATRQRTKTLPSNASRPIPAEDLSRRLRDIQELNALPVPLLKSHSLSPPDSHSPSNQLGQRSGDHARIPKFGVPDKSIRPMRSFHRPSLVDATSEQSMHVPPLPLETHRIGRSATTASRPIKERDQETSLRARSGSSYKRRPRTSDDTHQPSTALLHPSVFQRIATPRTPADVPVTPSITPSASKETKEVSWQQRVFIVDLQRFNTLTMSPTTTAKEVIDALEAQGQLANWAGVGGWMLFEVSQDFGMERPIRHFETVSEVINSWDKNKSVNLLVAKKTPLAALLHPSAMPSSSPVFSTYVEWESKPRKWSKRWLELREQGLWLSKKDTGKDEIFLCSLANFDAYMVTRTHKSPKPYVFAVKSTDNLSFFENAADYVHVFCCSEKDGKKWLESVLLARSYFINQERNTVSLDVLPSSNKASGKGKALSHSISRKGSRNVQQPLLNVSTPTATATPTSAYAFEPGSLLAKR